MPKYRVPLVITFDGAVEVEARDEVEAEEIAVANVRGGLDYVSTNQCDKILDHEFDLHGYSERRDNESIEEIEEDEEEDAEE